MKFILVVLFIYLFFKGIIFKLEAFTLIKIIKENHVFSENEDDEKENKNQNILLTDEVIKECTGRVLKEDWIKILL